MESPPNESQPRQAAPPIAKRVVSWKLALILLIAWWTTGDIIWTKLRSDPWQTGGRSLVENQLLAIEALEVLPPPAHRIEAIWRSQLTSSDAVNQILAPLLRKGDVASGVWIEYALVCHEFAPYDLTGNWAAHEAFAVARITHAPPNWSYFSAAADLLQKRVPSEINVTALKQACVDYPGDWWVNKTADRLGHHSIANEGRLATRRQKALHSLHVTAILEVLAMGVGLISTILVWKKRRSLAPTLRASKERFFRLWNPFAVLALFAATHAAIAPANIWMSRQMYEVARSMLGNAQGQISSSAYVVLSVISTVTTIALVLLTPLLLWMVFGPRKRSISPAFGFSSRDFLTSPCWIVGASACWVSLLLNYLADRTWRWLGFGGNAVDASTAWTFIAMGPAAWPAAFTFGVVIAPFAEEIIFRGFLFSAVRARFGPLTAGLFSSALFALAHFYSPFGTVCVFIFGLVFAFVYQVTGRLSWSMAAHACVNLLLTPIQLLEIAPS